MTMPGRSMRARVRFANLPVSIRLAAGFGALTVLLLVIAGVGWSTGGSWRATVRRMRAHAVVAGEVSTANLNMTSLALHENAIAADYAAGLPAAGDLSAYTALRRELGAQLTTLADAPLSTADRVDLTSAQRAFTAYVAQCEQINSLFAAHSASSTTRALHLVGQLASGSVRTPLTRIGADMLARSRNDARRGSSSASASQTMLLVIGLIAVLLALGTAVGIVRSIVRPLRKTVDVLQGVAAGDLTREVDVATDDEIGRMAAALNRALARIRSAMESVGDHSRALASASEGLLALAQQMAGNAEETSAQAGVVSAAAEQVSSNVQTVATGTEEMSASIREIAQSATDASVVASQGVGVATSTNSTVAKLGASTAEIGEVVKVITSTAEQTNLLALNATIEAARAGEAGKGFAIVANEVKELAKETARATEDIAARIEAIQADSTAAVDAIERIGAIMEKINEAQTTIASAVEEQTATTNEIGRNVAEAATGATDIAQNIAAVAVASADTTASLSDARQAVTDLTAMSGDLQRLVEQFSF